MYGTGQYGSQTEDVVTVWAVWGQQQNQLVGTNHTGGLRAGMPKGTAACKPDSLVGREPCPALSLERESHF